MPLGKGVTVESQVQKQLKNGKGNKISKDPNNNDNGDDDKDESKNDTIEKETVGGIQIEVFRKYNSNVEIYEIDMKNMKKRRIGDEYLTKTPNELNLKPNNACKIQFYSSELPDKVLIHELTWLEMMSALSSDEVDEKENKNKNNRDPKS